MTDKKLIEAKEDAIRAFRTVKAFLDEQELHYAVDEEDRRFDLSFIDNLECMIVADEERELLYFRFRTDIVVKKEDADKYAIAFSCANDRIALGGFEKDDGGRICLRYVLPFSGSLLAKKAVGNVVSGMLFEASGCYDKFTKVPSCDEKYEQIVALFS
ncbi:MAG: hypothetical protein IJ735_05810 [Clostridia bacterium]|nr:hypothetical protein [Clostridia bacterium]